MEPFVSAEGGALSHLEAAVLAMRYGPDGTALRSYAEIGRSLKFAPPRRGEPTEPTRWAFAVRCRALHRLRRALAERERQPAGVLAHLDRFAAPLIEYIQIEGPMRDQPTGTPYLGRETPIWDTPLSPRVKNALLRNGIATLGQLAELDEGELRAMRGVGVLGVERIKRVLEEIDPS